MLSKISKFKFIIFSLLLTFIFLLIAFFSIYYIHALLSIHIKNIEKNEAKTKIRAIRNSIQLYYNLNKESDNYFLKSFLKQHNITLKADLNAHQIQAMSQAALAHAQITAITLQQKKTPSQPCYKSIYYPIKAQTNLIYCFNHQQYKFNLLNNAINETRAYLKDIYPSLIFEVITKSNNLLLKLHSLYIRQKLDFPEYTNALSVNGQYIHFLNKKIQILQSFNIDRNEQVVIFSMFSKVNKLNLVQKITYYIIIYSLIFFIFTAIKFLLYTKRKQIQLHTNMLHWENNKTYALSNMAAGIAHEIRNPVNIISIVIQRLKFEFKPTEEKAKQEFLKLITTTSNEIQRITILISDFLDLLRPFKLNKNPFSITYFLEEQITRFSAQLSTTTISLETYLHDIKKNTFYGDKHRLGQVLLNIFQNALAASPEQSTIVLSAYTKSNMLYITIKDEGIGIQKKDLHYIFDMYFTTKAEGTGLGLYISRKIVQAHGGTITFTQNRSKGILVSITLPFMEIPTQVN